MARVLVIISVIIMMMICNSVSGSWWPSNFIRKHCRKTQNPDFCFHTLSFDATRIKHSQRRLVESAVSLSLNRTRSARAFLSIMAKFRGLTREEYTAVGDCIELMGDAVDELRESLLLIKRPGKGREFESRMAELNSDVSAALTDGDTCVDGFMGLGLDGKIEDAVKARMAYLGLFTSNALDLATEFASKDE